MLYVSCRKVGFGWSEVGFVCREVDVLTYSVRILFVKIMDVRMLHERIEQLEALIIWSFDVTCYFLSHSSRTKGSESGIWITVFSDL